MRPDVGAPRRPVVAAVEGTDGRRREWGGAQDLEWKVLALVQVSDDGDWTAWRQRQSPGC